MFQLQRYALIVTLLLPLFGLVPTANAQDLRVSTTPIDLEGFSPEQQRVANRLLEAHQVRLEVHRSSGELSRQDFDRLFDDLVDDLDRVFTTSVVFNKSGSPCSQACKAAETGSFQICDADVQAAIALAACPTSTYASLADIYASSECLISTVQTAPTTCQGPTAQAQALNLLTGSKQQSREAWNNAAYAWVQDNCTESYQTAVHASNAYFSFHDAKTLMANCN